MFVTREDLINLEACGYGLDRFTEEWPNGVEITEESLRRAFDIGLSVGWWAGRVFGAAYLTAKEPLWEAYLAAYLAAKRPLMMAYETARKPLWEAYLTAMKPSWEAYEAGRVQLILQLANNNNNNKET